VIVLYRAVAIGVCVACDPPPPWKRLVGKITDLSANRKITEKFKKVNELESLWKMVFPENFYHPPLLQFWEKKIN
jgi:hypothetical protein